METDELPSHEVTMMSHIIFPSEINAWRYVSVFFGTFFVTVSVKSKSNYLK